MGIQHLPLFLLAGFALNITPGPDMLFVIARSIGQGRGAGIASALGIGAGCFVHIFAVAFGLAQVLRAVPLAYLAVRYCGAAYLIYLGLRSLYRKDSKAELPAAAPASPWRIFSQGAITNILNPKVALFFLAFLPQFINSNSHSFTLATITLGMIFDLGGTLVNLAVAIIASYSAKRLLGGFLEARGFRWLTGSVFVGLGLRLAFAERAPSH